MGVARRGLCAALAALATMAMAGPADAAWEPGPAQYGVGQQMDVPVQMQDGTVLSANIYYPTNSNGTPASGPFPVIMVQNPYSKDSTSYTSGREGGGEASTELGPIPYLIQRGYIDVVVDVRGTGGSGGKFQILDPQQGKDGAELVRWAAQLPNANGKVGLYGPSYMGIDQFMTARALKAEGGASPLKAMFPIVAANDVYRDLAFMGGMPGAEFDLVFVGLMTAVETGGPWSTHYNDPKRGAEVTAEHAPGALDFQVGTTQDIESGGPTAYDEDFWQVRSVREMLDDVVDLDVPAFLIGGWFDVFQRGEPLNYSGLQNAWAGRSVADPMLPDQEATGRYQLLQGPWYHLDAGTGLDIYRMQLAWFDRWLKGVDTGIDRTDTPLHAYVVGADRWVDTAHYPFAEATPQSFYLGEGGALSADAPTAASGADQLVYTASLGSPCGRQSDQWGAGGAALAFGIMASSNPCANDDSTQQKGPGALTYTTPALTSDTVLAGPVTATIYATSTAPEVLLEATLEDVAPDGSSKPLTTGALTGSHRALDEARSWRGADGKLLLPYHPYTRAASSPVPTGQVTRFDIEIFPTLAQLAAGHRLRLTLTSSDFPHLLPTLPQAQGLAGGVYQVQRNAGAASFVQVPLAAPNAFKACSICQ